MKNFASTFLHSQLPGGIHPQSYFGGTSHGHPLLPETNYTRDELSFSHAPTNWLVVSSNSNGGGDDGRDPISETDSKKLSADSTFHLGQGVKLLTKEIGDFAKIHDIGKNNWASDTFADSRLYDPDSLLSLPLRLFISEEMRDKSSASSLELLDQSSVGWSEVNTWAKLGTYLWTISSNWAVHKQIDEKDDPIHNQNLWWKATGDMGMAGGFLGEKLTVIPRGNALDALDYGNAALWRIGGHGLSNVAWGLGAIGSLFAIRDEAYQFMEAQKNDANHDHQINLANVRQAASTIANAVPRISMQTWAVVTGGLIYTLMNDPQQTTQVLLSLPVIGQSILHFTEQGAEALNLAVGASEAEIIEKVYRWINGAYKLPLSLKIAFAGFSSIFPSISLYLEKLKLKKDKLELKVFENKKAKVDLESLSEEDKVQLENTHKKLKFRVKMDQLGVAAGGFLLSGAVLVCFPETDPHAFMMFVMGYTITAGQYIANERQAFVGMVKHKKQQIKFKAKEMRQNGLLFHDMWQKDQAKLFAAIKWLAVKNKISKLFQRKDKTKQIEDSENVAKTKLSFVEKIRRVPFVLRREKTMMIEFGKALIEQAKLEVKDAELEVEE